MSSSSSSSASTAFTHTTNTASPNITPASSKISKKAAAMSAAMRLPPEILFQIASHVKAVISTPTANEAYCATHQEQLIRKTGCACSLVCRSWVPLGLELLYAITIVLPDGGKYVSRIDGQPAKHEYRAGKALARPGAMGAKFVRRLLLMQTFETRIPGGKNSQQQQPPTGNAIIDQLVQALNGRGAQSKVITRSVALGRRVKSPRVLGLFSNVGATLRELDLPSTAGLVLLQSVMDQGVALPLLDTMHIRKGLDKAFEKQEKLALASLDSLHNVFARLPNLHLLSVSQLFNCGLAISVPVLSAPRAWDAAFSFPALRDMHLSGFPEALQNAMFSSSIDTLQTLKIGHTGLGPCHLQYCSSVLQAQAEQKDKRSKIKEFNFYTISAEDDPGTLAAFPDGYRPRSLIEMLGWLPQLEKLSITFATSNLAPVLNAIPAGLRDFTLDIIAPSDEAAASNVRELVRWLDVQQPTQCAQLEHITFFIDAHRALLATGALQLHTTTPYTPGPQLARLCERRGIRLTMPEPPPPPSPQGAAPPTAGAAAPTAPAAAAGPRAAAPNPGRPRRARARAAAQDQVPLFQLPLLRQPSAQGVERIDNDDVAPNANPNAAGNNNSNNDINAGANAPPHQRHDLFGLFLLPPGQQQPGAAQGGVRAQANLAQPPQQQQQEQHQHQHQQQANNNQGLGRAQPAPTPTVNRQQAPPQGQGQGQGQGPGPPLNAAGVLQFTPQQMAAAQRLVTALLGLAPPVNAPQAQADAGGAGGAPPPVEPQPQGDDPPTAADDMLIDGLADLFWPLVEHAAAGPLDDDDDDDDGGWSDLPDDHDELDHGDDESEHGRDGGAGEAQGSVLNFE